LTVRYTVALFLRPGSSMLDVPTTSDPPRRPSSSAGGASRRSAFRRRQGDQAALARQVFPPVTRLTQNSSFASRLRLREKGGTRRPAISSGAAETRASSSSGDGRRCQGPDAAGKPAAFAQESPSCAHDAQGRHPRPRANPRPTRASTVAFPTPRSRSVPKVERQPLGPPTRL